ncbi:OmpP1/FadL family transporter [Aquimarina pacifica]|uniref:OmpP1/FadL family transporter n=1 Tax=Aquimarina pacifica TaxID=1296415 RepID=UPI000471910F|nr:hypothetical protein [Aquimarina pacifica]
MKKIFLFIGILSMQFLNAQDITDAVRYSQQEILGTARYRGMSGAFGALGGDLSALQINPAGSAIFLNSFGSITLSGGRVDNDVLYFNGFNNTNTGNANFNQVGVVFIHDDYNPESTGINKLTLGLTYDQTTDNADELFVFGQSTNSIDELFLSESQGLPLDLISRRTGETVNELYSFLGETEGYSAQQAFLGHETFIIEPTDPDDSSNTSYFSNVAPGVFNHEYINTTTGINGKLTANIGAQIDKDFFIGLNLNSHFINFDRVTEFFEGNNNTGSNINEILFTNRLSTFGSGFSAQIGGIAKVSKMVRVGASFETPTWYYLEEETSQRLTTVSDTDGTAFANPNVINIFPGYQITTPAKATGSIALLFDKKGLISLDYSYKDYSTTKLSSDEGIDFSSINDSIEENLQAASTLRIGTEWRYYNWSIRGGYSFEESPYKDNLILGDKTGISIGTGFSFDKYKFDVAYTHTYQERLEQFYPNSAFSNAALVENNTTNFTFTLGMNF